MSKLQFCIFPEYGKLYQREATNVFPHTNRNKDFQESTHDFSSFLHPHINPVMLPVNGRFVIDFSVKIAFLAVSAWQPWQHFPAANRLPLGAMVNQRDAGQADYQQEKVVHLCSFKQKVFKLILKK
jgi:hypothetical protein